MERRRKRFSLVSEPQPPNPRRIRGSDDRKNGVWNDETEKYHFRYGGGTADTAEKEHEQKSVPGTVPNISMHYDAWQKLWNATDSFCPRQGAQAAQNFRTGI
ncbi:MAG: hypothetical protein LUH42_03905 [Oscillospiraceae bacterium]|nr:hypothetical protein [Oscillospiraceae bacterium]